MENSHKDRTVQYLRESSPWDEVCGTKKLPSGEYLFVIHGYDFDEVQDVNCSDLSILVEDDSGELVEYGFQDMGFCNTGMFVSKLCNQEELKVIGLADLQSYNENSGQAGDQCLFNHPEAVSGSIQVDPLCVLDSGSVDSSVEPYFYEKKVVQYLREPLPWDEVCRTKQLDSKEFLFVIHGYDFDEGGRGVNCSNLSILLKDDSGELVEYGFQDMGFCASDSELVGKICNQEELKVVGLDDLQSYNENSGQAGDQCLFNHPEAVSGAIQVDPLCVLDSGSMDSSVEPPTWE